MTAQLLEKIVGGPVDNPRLKKTILVRPTVETIREIAAASVEQNAGIDQMNKAAMGLDELTQQNAALVEEAAASSESMGQQADNLNRLMTFFTVEESVADPEEAA